MRRPVTVVVPGDLETRTGGYEYDRQLVRALESGGWDVEVATVPNGYPRPDAAARAAAGEVLARIADGTPVLVDGLAMGVLPEEVRAEAGRLRFVALVHHPLARESGLPPALAQALFESERQALSVARHVVVTSPATVTALADYGVTVDAVTVVLPGTVPAPLAVGSGGTSPRLLCVGALIPRKGHTVLLEALDRVREWPWTLAVAGSPRRDPATAAAVHGLVQRYEWQGRVEFLGELSEAELADEYTRADVFVLPSLYEGYGMVVAEALARGIPVVATDTGDVSHLLSRGAGLVVAPGDACALAQALRVVLSDPSALASLAAGARRARQELPTWQSAAEAMGLVLERVAA